MAPDHVMPSPDRNESVPREIVHEQLARILRSPVFAQAPMLSRLLQYLVDRTLRGDATQLKEYAIGVEVFDRGASFDPRTDTIVRVQARRLRFKLEEYYRGAGEHDAIVLDLPKGRYIVGYRRAAPSLPAETLPVDERAPLSHPMPGVAEAATGATPAGGPSIVVLPFANLSDDPGNEYFSDGLTEEIINALASVPDLRVVARTSAFQFKGRGEDIRKIGKELGVLTALEGSVRKDGHRLRVAAQLVEVHTGFHLWSHMFERELTGVFEIQDEITRAIFDALEIQLTPKRDRHVPQAPLPEAYEWFLRGRYFYHKVTLAGVEKSVECMKRAIALDGRFAAAHASLADTYVLWMSLAGDAGRGELLAKARRSAQAALALDAGSADAHCSLGEVLAVGDWNFAEAEREFLTALDLKPSFAHARWVYAMGSLCPRRRYEEALVQMRTALNADPVSVFLRTMLGQVLILAGQPDAAVGELRKALELEDGYAFANYTLALAYFAKSCDQEALDVLLRISDTEEIANYLGHLGYAHARVGNRAEAERALQRLTTRSWVPAVDVAAIYNGLGDRQMAMDWLERAHNARHFDALFVREDPRFANLRTEPRLTRLF
jgi:serine/threonine-protein kinase